MSLPDLYAYGVAACMVLGIAALVAAPMYHYWHFVRADLSEEPGYEDLETEFFEAENDARNWGGPIPDRDPEWGYRLARNPPPGSVWTMDEVATLHDNPEKPYF